ncbi:MAG: hypothetical protein J0L87_12835 [Bacteroidetes bacterium]|nr:hypothetical protein [Bacteroidota bacterium]
MNPETQNVILGAVLGALFAVVGGGVGKKIEMWLNLRQERSFIKKGLIDELDEIITVIGKLKETFEQTSQTPKSYIIDLKSNIEAYNHHRHRLFVLQGDDLRHKIIQFYRKLKDSLEDAEGKVGTLATSPQAKQQQKDIVSKMEKFEQDAKELKKLL